MKKALRYARPEIPAGHFLDTNDRNGNSVGWTLSTILGDMLVKAEAMYGDRNCNYSYLGIELGYNSDCIAKRSCGRYLTSRVDLNTIRNDICTWRQLAHDCVHLLSPTGNGHTTCLEEGLAVHFELSCMREEFRPGTWKGNLTFTSDCPALNMVEQLLDIEPSAIKLLRAHEPTISRISAELIVNVCPLVPRDLAIQLAAPFSW
jgi:hypothetical protein